jgi:hypothetical protein
MQGNQELLDFNKLEFELRANLENNPNSEVMCLNDVLSNEEHKCYSYDSVGDHQKAENMRLELTENTIGLCDNIIVKDPFLTEDIHKKMLATSVFLLGDKLGNQVKEKNYSQKLCDYVQKLKTLTTLNTNVFPPQYHFKTAAEEKNELQHDQITYGNDNFEYEKNEEVKTDENKHPDTTPLGEMQ